MLSRLSPHRRIVKGLAAGLLLLCGSFSLATPLAPVAPRLAPPSGKLYHGVYPGGVTGEEDDLAESDLTSYESVVGKTAAWVYFSNNWYSSRSFPLATATWIRGLGAIPYIRLMLRSTPDQYKRARGMSPKNILAGQLDEDLKAWGRAARDFSSPLILEYGTECNGEWFPWNGRWNGAGRLKWGDPLRPDGPERFAQAFRRIVGLMRGEGAANITWVFHVNAEDWPQKEWNTLENYYPGDDVVDWVAVSAYGPQTPLDDSSEHFRDRMDRCYFRLQALAPTKPVIVAEFGCSAGNPLIAPDAWAAPALADLLGGRWPAVIGFSWWNERWQNDSDPAHDTTMRVQDTPALAAVFVSALEANEHKLIQRPVP